MSKKPEMKTKDLTQTREDTYIMSNCLKSLAKTKLSVFIKFDIGHNINKMKDTVDLIDDIKGDNDDIEGFTDYQKGIRDIFMKHAVDGIISGAEKTAAYHSDLEKYREDNSKVTDALETKEKELKEKLQEEETLEGLIVLPLSRFPEETEIDLTPIMPLLERD